MAPRELIGRIEAALAASRIDGYAIADALERLAPDRTSLRTVSDAERTRRAYETLEAYGGGLRDALGNSPLRYKQAPLSLLLRPSTRLSSDAPID